MKFANRVYLFVYVSIYLAFNTTSQHFRNGVHILMSTLPGLHVVLSVLRERPLLGGNSVSSTIPQEADRGPAEMIQHHPSETSTTTKHTMSKNKPGPAWPSFCLFLQAVLLRERSRNITVEDAPIVNVFIFI